MSNKKVAEALARGKEELRKKKNRDRMAKYRLSKKNKLPKVGSGELLKKMVGGETRKRNVPVQSADTKDTHAGVITLTIVQKLVTRRNGFTYGELFGMILATVVIGAAFYFIV